MLARGDGGAASRVLLGSAASHASVAGAVRVLRLVLVGGSVKAGRLAADAVGLRLARGQVLVARAGVRGLVGGVLPAGAEREGEGVRRCERGRKMTTGGRRRGGRDPLALDESEVSLSGDASVDGGRGVVEVGHDVECVREREEPG